MPIYHYKCNKCGLDLEIFRNVKHRDELDSIRETYCPERKKRMATDGKVIMVDINVENCELKRVPTKSNFKI